MLFSTSSSPISHENVLEVFEDFLREVGLAGVIDTSAWNKFLQKEDKTIEALIVKEVLPPISETYSEGALDDLYTDVDNARQKWGLSSDDVSALTLQEKENVGVRLAEDLEDFMDENELTYPDEERKEAIEDGDDGAAIIYGTRFGNLLDDLHFQFAADAYETLDALMTDVVDADECSTKAAKRARFDGIKHAYYAK